jgi:hypothetical protein
VSIVAYQGEAEFDGCTWSDQDGWRIRWRLISLPGDQVRAHPMKKFTKRRGDRVGTRFQAALNPIAFGSPYAGEQMLVAWSDSTSGWSATFEYPDEPAFVRGCLRKAKDHTGTRFMMVLAEIDDDEGVVNQKQREAAERAQQLGKKLMLRSNRAAMRVKDPMFHEWLRETAKDCDWGETSADAWLKHQLGIESKSDLDDARNTFAIKRFGEIIQQFEEWRDGPQRR